MCPQLLVVMSQLVSLLLSRSHSKQTQHSWLFQWVLVFIACSQRLRRSQPLPQPRRIRRWVGHTVSYQLMPRLTILGTCDQPGYYDIHLVAFLDRYWLFIDTTWLVARMLLFEVALSSSLNLSRVLIRMCWHGLRWGTPLPFHLWSTWAAKYMVDPDCDGLFLIRLHRACGQLTNVLYH